MDRQRRRGLGFCPGGALCALDPGLGLFGPPLPGQHGSKHHEGDAGGRLVVPAVPPGQLDRPHTVLCRPLKRPVDRRLVCHAGELEIWPPDPARQRHALFQVPLCLLEPGGPNLLLEPGGPDLGDAEADQRQRPQVLTQAGLRRLRRLGQGLQPPRLLGHRRQVSALAGQQQPDDPEQHVQLHAPAGRHRRRPPLRQAQIPLRRLQRPPGQLIRRGQRRQLGIRCAGLGGEPGEQLMRGGGLPVQVQAGPVVGEQPGGQGPVPRRLGVPDRLHPEPVPGKPAGGRPVQPGDLTRGGAPQLELQQAGEQPVIAEPRPLPRPAPPRTRSPASRSCKHPLPAAASGQQVGELAVDPLQHAGAQQQPPHRLGLPVQHLGQQVLGHRPLGAGELGREPRWIRVPGQRQRRQPQPCRPALRPLLQHHHRRLGQLQPGRVEQLPCLSHREPQIGLADLGQLALQPQPVQAPAARHAGWPARTAAAAAPA